MEMMEAQTPSWFAKKQLDEVIFSYVFLEKHPMVSVNGTFFTKNGIVNEEGVLKKLIYDELKECITTGLPKKVNNLLEVISVIYQEALPSSLTPM